MTRRRIEHVGEAFRLLVDGIPPRAQPATHEIELTAGDGALLLADWLGCEGGIWHGRVVLDV